MTHPLASTVRSADSDRDKGSYDLNYMVASGLIVTKNDDIDDSIASIILMTSMMKKIMIL